MDSPPRKRRSVPRLQNREMEYGPIYQEIGRTVWDYYRARAGAKVAWALKHRLLPHPTTLDCGHCGHRAWVYDHRDYAKPLEVTALCDICNHAAGPAILRPEDIVNAIRYSSKMFTASEPSRR